MHSTNQNIIGLLVVCFTGAMILIHGSWHKNTNIPAHVVVTAPMKTQAAQAIIVKAVTQTTPPPVPSIFEDAAPIVMAHQTWTQHLSSDMHSLNQQPVNDRQLTVMGPLGPACKHLETFGTGDGEKRACGLAADSAAASNCTIISLGSNNEWGFEEAVFDQLPCYIETFDCTVLATVPPRIASRTRFHHACIAGSDRVEPSGSVYLSWESSMRMIGMQMPPVYLKMDIEGWEYEVITNILDRAYLMPRQIAFEIHTGGKTLGAVAGFMESLYIRGGYFYIDYRPNVLCGSCTEVLVSRLSD